MKETKQEVMKMPKTWETVESPNFFKFVSIGDTIEGILLSKDISSRYGFGLYTIRTFDGIQKRFHGSSQLDDLLLNIDVLNYVKITYVDNQETSNGNMKLFEVKRGSN